MSDYIDRAALGIGLCNRDVFENKSYADGWNAAVKILKEAPTADIPEVTHGHGVTSTRKKLTHKTFWKNFRKRV